MSSVNTAAAVPVSIEDEMEASYLSYAMSVIVSRAIPDVRDGFKPVHRRIMYAMHEMRNTYDKPYKKSSRIVGNVMGKYHPHGDSAIYMSLVRLAQPFSLGVPLVDGQGNFGSVDGDSPAQMRYTEVRLSKISNSLLCDISYDTVDFKDNYDAAEREPTVLPARFPNILVNGGSGIAVGMATSIPTHNLGEVIDGCIAYLANPEITVSELVEYIPAPDFPTGATIINPVAAKAALIKGRGAVIVRSKVSVEELSGDRSRLVVTEIPYQVNKSELLKKIEELVKAGVIEGISDICDESNKLGIRVVIELKRATVPDVVLNRLYKHTNLQASIPVNMLALNKSRPEVMNVRDVIVAFIEFREDVVSRRTKYLLDQARNRAHLLIGLNIALDNIDEVVRIIRASRDQHEARDELFARRWPAVGVQALVDLVEDEYNVVLEGMCRFTEKQVKAILEMRLQRLTGLEKDKIIAELEALALEIKRYLGILNSPEEITALIKEELTEIKDKFAEDRKTEIIPSSEIFDDEDLIPREDMVVTITKGGYIKRTPLSMYRAQRRGGKGRSALAMNNDDFTTDVLTVDTHTEVLFFSNVGKVYSMKAYKLPLGSIQSKGRAIVNILPLDVGEVISYTTAISSDKESDETLFFATANGYIRRNKLSDFANINRGGKIAIRLEGDTLVGVCAAAEDDIVMLASSSGKAMCFAAKTVRIFKSRSSSGIRGISLGGRSSVISLSSLGPVGYDEKDVYLSIPTERRIEMIRFIHESEDEVTQASFIERFGRVDGISDEQLFNMARSERFILSITENGFGKRTSAYYYRITNRGGKGIINIDTGDRNGDVVFASPVIGSEDIFIITDKGTAIRTSVSEIAISNSRGAKGVKVLNIKEGERVISANLIVSDRGE